MVREEILTIDRNSKVILFGSRARGDFREDSDWDFLIVLDREISRELKDVIRENLYDIELDTEQIISSIIYQREDWEDMEVTLLYQIIHEEGIEV